MSFLKQPILTLILTVSLFAFMPTKTQASAEPAAAPYEFLTALETLKRQRPGEIVALGPEESLGVDISSEEEAAFRAAFITFTNGHPGFVQYYAAYNFDPRYEGSHLALNNFRESFGQYAGQLSEMLQTWMTVNEYKNHPTSAEHSEEIVAFSRALKMSKTALNLAIADNRRIEDTWYDRIKTTDSLCNLFDNMQEAYVQAQQIRRDIEALPTRAAFLAALPADPLQMYLITDVFALTVLDMARALSIRAENPLNAMDHARRNDIARVIIQDMIVDDAAWKEDPHFLAGILRIFEENFG